jgi:L-lactate dehydrogenase complex protein LldG
VRVERAYRRGSDEPSDTVVARFVERVADYRAEVERVAAASLREAVASACERHGARRLVAPEGVPGAARPDGVELLDDDGLTHADLDSMDAVLTGCAAAIADTGTIVLDGGPDQGRRALTLVPDLHICIVPADRIVASVPEGTARVAAAVAQQHRPITLISGPSATSDIELRRVEGVHGPRRLVVLVVE